MNKEKVLKAIEKARENSKKRKFNQSFDLVINLKNLNLKKPDNNVSLFINLPFEGKKIKIGCFADTQLGTKAKECCDRIILKKEFDSLDKKTIKNMVREMNFFVAQADLMPDIAKHFGKILGARGKMPNPKAGCIVPENVNLKPLFDRLKKTVKLETKSELTVKCAIGLENMKTEELVENILTVYNSLLNSLPQEKNNIKEVILKLTMGKPIKIEI